jgi:hypothetical protein
MARGRFRNRVCHLSSALFRGLLGLAAGANGLVFGLPVYQPSTRTGRTQMYWADLSAALVTFALLAAGVVTRRNYSPRPRYHHRGRRQP